MNKYSLIGCFFRIYSELERKQSVLMRESRGVESTQTLGTYKGVDWNNSELGW
jgi:hypothetical protein